jgi:hypothetical protein
MSGGGRLSTIDVLRRGWRASPELRTGAGVTLLMALVAAGGRVVVPVLVQQMLDRGVKDGPDRPVFWLQAASSGS